MRSLLVLAMLASVANAGEPEDTLRDLGWSFGAHPEQVRPCTELLARLSAMHVSDGTRIFTLRRDLRTVGDARRECKERERAAKVDAMANLIEQAVRFPWAWAGKCMDAWPQAIANGLQPTEPIERVVNGRRGRVVLAGTIEQLRVKWCDNAYTPRRRGE